MEKSKQWGGILLVAGTQIGAGMLALPLATGEANFFAAIALFFICFLVMTFSVYLLLEATLACTQKNANLISISRQFLGPLGVLIAVPSFLLLLYSAAAAYIAGGGQLVASFLSPLHIGVHPLTAAGVFTLFILLLVLSGMRLVDYFNRVFMCGLIVSYLTLLVMIAPHVQAKWVFSAGNNATLWLAAPIVMLSFTSHVIVPSLNAYYQSDVSLLKRVLLFGGLLSLILYLFWELAILGVFPKVGVGSIQAIMSRGSAIAGLGHTLEHQFDLVWVAYAVAIFSLCALVTSFLGILTGLIDFICDGFGWVGRQRNYAILLSIVPPFLFVSYDPTGFLTALGWAGISVAILYGVLPVLIVWKIRYIEKRQQVFQVVGGRLSLLLLVVAAAFMIVVQGIKLWH